MMATYAPVVAFRSRGLEAINCRAGIAKRPIAGIGIRSWDLGVIPNPKAPIPSHQDRRHSRGLLSGR
jgi:hypothetical protein